MNEPRVALVTGAARGQGRAIVERLRHEGFRVAASDVLVEELGRAYDTLRDTDIFTLELDVTSEQSWERAMTQVEERFGGLDVLVNNAGVLRGDCLMNESIADFERQWRVNALGQFLGMRAAVRLLRKSDGAAVVNTVSTVAVRAMSGSAGYTASKWCARGLHLTAAAELAELGIRVNAVLPGPIATPMLEPAMIERLSQAPLLGRIGQPDDIAGLVAFLASDIARFLTGAEIIADGGHILRIPH